MNNELVVKVEHMTLVQYLPGADRRIETGVVVFGEDWPGLFFRGDDALHFASAVRAAAQTMSQDPDKAIQAMVLNGLANTLESCEWSKVKGEKKL